MAARLKIGLVGCGSFGKFLGKYFQESADIAALCDTNRAGMDQTAEHLAINVPQYSDYRKMFRDAKLDAVAVTAANFVHMPITIAAAKRGLHVFCEKAMALNTRECWKMVRACEENNVKLMVGHKRRLRPPWARMIELTRDDLLGPPLAITVTQYADMRPYNYPGTWWADPKTAGGGMLTLLGVHVIDWFGAMCGDAAQVSAVYGPQLDAGYKFPDVSHATYVFQSGAIATINSSSAYPLHRFREAQGPRVQCRGGAMKLEPFMDHIDLYWQRLDEDEPHHERFDDLGFDHAYRLETSDFVRWITEDRKPCLTWVEGLRCVEMMEAAYRSADRGGRVVTFPLHPKLESSS
jgi:glucose-fructose oxidoreductase